MRELLRMYKIEVVASMIVAWVSTKEPKFLAWAIAALSTDVLSTSAKHLWKGHPGWQRPKGAVNCSGFPRCDSGVNPLGMPSGHAWGSSFLATSAAYHIWQTYPKKRWMVLIPIMASLLIILSRTTALGKWSGGGLGSARVACHTEAQLIVGAILGFAQAVVFIKTKAIRQRLYPSHT